MTEYETTVIMRPDVSGESIEATLDKVRGVVKQDGGKLIAMKHWGRRKLAYDIDKQSRGIYVHASYLGKGALVAEVERNLRIADNVMRFLTVKIADGVEPDARQEQAYVRPEYDAEEAAAASAGDGDDFAAVGAAQGTGVHGRSDEGDAPDEGAGDEDQDEVAASSEPDRD